MIPEQFGYFIILSTTIGYFFYFKDLFFGETKPNLISWFIWMLAPFVGVFFQFKAGASFFSILPIFIAGFGPMLVLITSLIKKNGYWKITKFDIFCGLFSLLALVIYILTKNLGISILFAILSDGLAAIPTIVKSWKFPHTETGILYLSGILNNIIGLLIIKNWIFPIYSFGVYFIIVNTIIIFSIYRRRIFKTKSI